MHKSFYAPLFFAGLSSAFADDSVKLPNFVVTATRTATPTNQLSAATTIYTREDIEQYQVNTLPELLQRTTGVDMVQQGGLGKNTSIFMRGTNSDHVLVLIDGIKAGSVTSGTTPFQYLPIDQIERIEIIRGPQSSLYGSEAIGGVIQIFTRQGKQQEKPSITLDAGGGNYSTLQTSGSISGRWRDAWYSLSASHINSQGFDAREPTSRVNDPDNDGYYNTGLNAKLGYQFDNDATIEAFYMRTEGKTEFDGTPSKTEFTNQVVGISGAMDLTDNWHSTLRLGQSRDDNTNLKPNGSFYSRFDTTRWNVSWVNELQLHDNHQLVFGSDYRMDEVDSSANYTDSERYDVGIFGELHSRLFDNHYFNASLRWDENEAFGDYVTGSFGWRFNWDYGLSAFANFGNAFKAPSLNDLYFPNQGNPNLEPEESTTFEIGLAGAHDWLNWEFRAYHTNIDNLINWAPDDNGIWRPSNVDKAQIDGIETEINAEIYGWNNKLGFQFLSPKDRVTNTRLLRRAEKILNYDLSRSFDALDIGATLLARGDSFDKTGNRNKLSGFVTVDLRAAYHINKHWRVSAKLNNLLDKQYQLADTYNTADRNFFVAIHYNN